MNDWKSRLLCLAVLHGSPLVLADSGLSAGGGRGLSAHYSEFGAVETFSGESTTENGASIRHGFIGQLTDTQVLVRPLIDLVGDPNFGELPVIGVSSSERIFTIVNNGIADLVLTGAARVEVTGLASTDFTLIQQPPVASVPIGGSTQFQVRFNPSLPGSRRAALRVRSNDPSRDPLLFDLVGFGSVSKLIPQSIAFTAPSVVYLGQGTLPLRATSTSGLPVEFRVVSGPGAIQGSVLTVTGVGTIRVQATATADQTYAGAREVIRSIVVKPTPTTLTLMDLVHTYDAQPHGAATLGASNVLISYSVSGSLTTAPPTAAGVYPVTATANGKVVRGNLVIAKAPLYATPNSVRRFVGQPNPPFTIAYEGFASGDTETSVFAASRSRRPTATTAAKASSPGGLYPIVAAGGALANYAFVYRSGSVMVETFAGQYEALLENHERLPVGKVVFAVARASNALSGSFAVPGEVSQQGFRAPLVLDPRTETATSSVPLITKGSNSYKLDLALTFGGGFTSSLSINSTPAESLSGNNGKLIQVIPRGERVSFAGAHTCILESPEPPSDTSPSGLGHATANVTAQGALLISGVLADGTKFNTSLLPDADSGYRFHVQPYKRKNSYLAGWLYLDPHPTLVGRRFIDRTDNQTILWRKEEGLKDRTYPSGFGPVTCKMLLDPWIPPTRATALGSLLELPNSGEFGVTIAEIASDSFDSLPSRLRLDSKNRLIVTAPQTTQGNAVRWLASVNPATGSITGGFRLLDQVPAPTRTDPNATKTNIRTVNFGGVFRQAHGIIGPLGAGNALISPLPQAGSSQVISRGIWFEK